MPTYEECLADTNELLSAVEKKPYYQELSGAEKKAYHSIFPLICRQMDWLGLGNETIDFQVLAKNPEQLGQLHDSLATVNQLMCNDQFRKDKFKNATSFSQFFESIKDGLTQNKNVPAIYDLIFKNVHAHHSDNFEAFLGDAMQQDERVFEKLREGNTLENLKKMLLRYYIYQLAHDDQGKFQEERMQIIINDYSNYPIWLQKELRLWAEAAKDFTPPAGQTADIPVMLSRMLVTSTFKDNGHIAPTEPDDCSAIKALVESQTDSDELDQPSLAIETPITNFEAPNGNTYEAFISLNSISTLKREKRYEEEKVHSTIENLSNIDEQDMPILLHEVQRPEFQTGLQKLDADQLKNLKAQVEQAENKWKEAPKYKDACRLSKLFQLLIHAIKKALAPSQEDRLIGKLKEQTKEAQQHSNTDGTQRKTP